MASPVHPPRPGGVTDTQAPPILATIVATIGPASESPEVVRRLIEAGVGIFRFNFSHGTFEDHARRLKTVRETAAAMGCVVGCLGDLQGPKIRVGKIPAGVGVASPSGGGMIEVVTGQDVVLKAGIAEAFMRENASAPKGAEPVLPVTYQDMVTEVQPGQRVLINDGAIRLLAVEADYTAKGGGELRCRVTCGGRISSGKGINLPQSDIKAPAITPRDWECVAWAVEHELDFLALSFVRTPDEVIELKQRLVEMCPVAANGEKTAAAWMPVVAKIEKPQAVANIEAIVEAADAIMVARGDLGVEMDIYKVPVVQKQIVATCDLFGKPCIVATQMLETMIESPIPTRAEASDVANAIFDGADAVMLSAETAAGKHPVLVVETMARIVAAAEDELRHQPLPEQPPTKLMDTHRGTAALAHGAWQVARDLNARLVACWSQNGGTARYLSQNRFNVPIIAYSSSEQATRRMTILHAVTPVHCPQPPATLSEWNLSVDEYVQRRGLAAKGDAMVLLAGRPLGKAKATNTLAIHRVGENSGYTGHGPR
jgi:pyruvate kinase